MYLFSGGSALINYIKIHYIDTNNTHNATESIIVINSTCSSNMNKTDEECPPIDNPLEIIVEKTDIQKNMEDWSINMQEYIDPLHISLHTNQLKEVCIMCRY
jgi:hypothetical protein